MGSSQFAIFYAINFVFNTAGSDGRFAQQQCTLLASHSLHGTISQVQIRTA